MSDLSDRVGTGEGPQPSAESENLRAGRWRTRAWALLLSDWSSSILLAGTLCLLTFAQSAIPGVNESHWLGKARAAWGASFCPGDFFYASTSAHYVFLTLIGPLTTVASLPVVAGIGRFVACLGLASALVRFLPKVVGDDWNDGLLLFYFLQCIGNLSGEWLFGGVEAKQFAYAALLMSVVDLGTAKWSRAAAWLGGAIALHPVIGVWGAVTVAGAMAVRQPVGVPWRRAVLVAALFALPGLIPVVSMLGEAPSAAVAQSAALEQVYGRLRHHLDPTDFAWSSYAYYAALLTVWLLLTRLRSTTETGWWFRRMVEFSGVIAVVGLIVGVGAAWLDGRLTGAGEIGAWSTRAATVLKFYPFRLFDLFLPLGVACEFWAFVQGTLWRHSIGTLIFFGFMMAISFYPSPLARTDSDSKLTPQLWADFREAAGWIRAETPNDSLVVTPTFSRDFKWYAERAEFVCHKDCPQDAAGVVEWRRRMNYWKTWRQQAFATAGAGDPITPSELAGLARDTGATHLLIHAAVTVEAEPLFRNGTFAVYELPRPNAAVLSAD
jgi:hypothetical protein